MVDFWLGTFPIAGHVRALANMAERDGWDGFALTDSQNLQGTLSPRWRSPRTRRGT